MDYVKRVDWDVFPYGPNVDDECFSDTLRDIFSDEKCTLKTFRRNNIDKIIFANFNITLYIPKNVQGTFFNGHLVLTIFESFSNDFKSSEQTHSILIKILSKMSLIFGA